MNWIHISLGFSVFTWITGAIAFCIIKFNDFKHLEDTVEKLSVKQEKTEEKQNVRHEENIKELAKLSKEVAYLCGKQDTNE